MNQELSVKEFGAFFREIHGHSPFPWQERLLRQVVDAGTWPDVLDFPTGFGKTAALDVAVFHLALEAEPETGRERRAPVRMALVVDRRLVVDDAFKRAEQIADALLNAKPDSVVGRVAKRLRFMAGADNPPLLARRLRGGLPREDDWARTPSQPTILCSTVDQVGSRLLFRGYGVSDSMKPIHAGLLGSDCLILLDEAHLSEPFRQSLRWVNAYRGAAWRENGQVSPWGVTVLTATPADKSVNRFALDEKDLADTILSRRWTAPKPARIVDLRKTPPKETGAQNVASEEGDKSEEKLRINTLVNEALEGMKALTEAGNENPAVAVVVNRVARARGVFQRIQKACEVDDGTKTADSILLIGPSRAVERDELAQSLKRIRTGQASRLDKPLFIVSTQCIEVGVDIDLDGLITDAAPIDALRQRFGRLNRDGTLASSYAAIVGGAKSDAKDDPVYGEAIDGTWKYLHDVANRPVHKADRTVVDFGLKALQRHLDELSPDQLKALSSPKEDAPILMPAHLDLLSQTAPIPNADPEVALYLHGPNRSADAVTLVWRADVVPAISKEDDLRTRRLLLHVPPRPGETIELPAWVVRKWLQQTAVESLADVPAKETDSRDDNEPSGHAKGAVFRWLGDDDRSRWIDPAKTRINPGDTLVIPAAYGGVDSYGWNPEAEYANDVADEAAEAYSHRYFAVRIAPGLLKDNGGAKGLARAISGAGSTRWDVMRDAVMDAGLPDPVVGALNKLDLAKGKRKRVECYTDLYGEEDECPRGVVFVAPFGIADPKTEASGAAPESCTTEDDFSGSMPGFALSLQDHTRDVEKMVDQFLETELPGLSEDRKFDLRIAASLHDVGKADLRFQRWLAYDDPIGPDPDENQILAKSARAVPRGARATSGLPEKWRHEALSVRLAPLMSRFKEARDEELVLWLIGTHHGRGRPLFPHRDPADDKDRLNLPAMLGIADRKLMAGPGPQSLAYSWNGLDWPTLYERLKARYGVWELARMEAILRLADHRASEEARRVQTATKERNK